MLSKFSHRFNVVWFLLLGCLLGLSACQTVPPAKKLTAKQIAVLKEQGFTQKDDGWEFGLSAKILFGNDEADLTMESRPGIARIAKALVGADIQTLRLEGHTDSLGSPEYNQQLSMRRAQSVAREMVVSGMKPDNLNVRGLGMSKPVADNSTVEGRLENRRVTIIVPVE